MSYWELGGSGCYNRIFPLKGCRGLEKFANHRSKHKHSAKNFVWITVKNCLNLCLNQKPSNLTHFGWRQKSTENWYPPLLSSIWFCNFSMLKTKDKEKNNLYLQDFIVPWNSSELTSHLFYLFSPGTKTLSPCTPYYEIISVVLVGT